MTIKELSKERRRNISRFSKKYGIVTEVLVGMWTKNERAIRSITEYSTTQQQVVKACQAKLMSLGTANAELERTINNELIKKVPLF